jgi:hypothetical protein
MFGLITRKKCEESINELREDVYGRIYDETRSIRSDLQGICEHKIVRLHLPGIYECVGCGIHLLKEQAKGKLIYNTKLEKVK